MNDQPRRPVETPQEWLRYAEGDLGVVEREMLNETPAYHTVCFLCQSAAEKFLKGYLIAQGWTLEKTHDDAADQSTDHSRGDFVSAFAEYGEVTGNWRLEIRGTPAAGISPSSGRFA